MELVVQGVVGGGGRTPQPVRVDRGRGLLVEPVEVGAAVEARVDRLARDGHEGARGGEGGRRARGDARLDGVGRGGHPEDELHRRLRLPAVLGDREGRALAHPGAGAGGVPARHGHRGPLALLLGHDPGERPGAPGGAEVAERRAGLERGGPLGAVGGGGGDETVLDHALPVRGDLLRRRVTGVHLPGAALGGEPLGARLPRHRLEEGGVVGEEGREPGLGRGLPDLPRRRAEVGPRLRRLDPVLLEEVLAVVEDLRRRVRGDGPVLVAHRRQLDGLRQELLLHVRRHVGADVLQRALAHELRERGVLDGEDVGRDTGLEGVGDLRVAPETAGGYLLELHLDRVVRAVELVRHLLGTLGPGPETDGDGMGPRAFGGCLRARTSAGRDGGERGERGDGTHEGTQGPEPMAAHGAAPLRWGTGGRGDASAPGERSQDRMVD
ncbi:putative ABC transporter solute-binding lipoprotein [Streptomyces sp. Tu6071]|nr:putative ABC transporter solute-binding lipoprotein [Streptomyces sp. Tu6071]